MPQMIPVKSSNIAAVGYDPGTAILTVQFSSGRTYAFEDVPPGEHNDFMASNSKGSYFANHIKNQYTGKPA